jgi:hypothetical protein
MWACPCGLLFANPVVNVVERHQGGARQKRAWCQAHHFPVDPFSFAPRDAASASSRAAGGVATGVAAGMAGAVCVSVPHEVGARAPVRRMDGSARMLAPS